MDTNSPDNPVPQQPEAPPASGDVLSVISDVERRLLQLRDAHMETERARTRVVNLERELTQRSADATEQARRTAAELEAARGQREQVARAAAELERAQAELAEERARIAADLAQSERVMNEALAGISQREKAIAEREQAIARDQAAAEQMAAELAQQQDQARQAAGDLAERLRAATRDVDAGKQAVEQLSREAATLRSQAAASEEELAVLRARLEEAASQAAASREESEAGTASLRARSEEAGSRVAILEADLSAARQAGAELERKLGGALDELRQALESGEARGSEARKHGELAARLRKECEKHESSLKQAEERHAAASAEIAALKSQGQEWQATAAAEVATARKQADERQAAAVAEVAGLRKQAEKRLSAASAEISSLKSQAAERAQELSGTAQLLEKSRSAAQRLEAENTRITAALEKSTNQGQLLQQLLDESRGEAARAKSEIGGLAEAARLAKERAVELQHVPPDERVVTRRRRMQLVRRLLREQQGKLRTAGDALRERFRECEQILARREELAAARAAMVEVQRKLDRVQGKAVKSRAANMTLAIVALLGLLGGISWGVTTQFAPATYAVKAVIEADGRGRDLTEEELAEWRKFHEGLLTDPALMQAAAQKMASRGITSLGTAGLLSARLKKDMHHEAREDRLELELIGLGAARTSRELETFVTALVSHSQAGRDRRADGVATVITTSADAGPGPIQDQRPVYAGGVFAGTALLSGLLGFGLWRRLAAAKTRFEEEAQIDAVIDEANWGAAATFRPR